MKVGKEEICGLVAAVERYVSLDHRVVEASWEATVESWRASLCAVPGVEAKRLALNEAGQPVVRLELTIDPAAAGVTAREVVDRLWAGDPRVAVLPGREERIYVTPDTLNNGEAETVRVRLCEALASNPQTNEKEASDVA